MSEGLCPVPELAGQMDGQREMPLTLVISKVHIELDRDRVLQNKGISTLTLNLAVFSRFLSNQKRSQSIPLRLTKLFMKL